MSPYLLLPRTAAVYRFPVPQIFPTYPKKLSYIHTTLYRPNAERFNSRLRNFLESAYAVASCIERQHNINIDTSEWSADSASILSGITQFRVISLEYRVRVTTTYYLPPELVHHCQIVHPSSPLCTCTGSLSVREGSPATHCFYSINIKS